MSKMQKKWHSTINNCPARNYICKKCKKRGHFTECCLSKKIQNIEYQEEETTQINCLNMLNVNAKSQSNRSISIEIWQPKIRNSLKFTIKATPDTGAEVCVCGEDIYKKIGSPRLSKSDEKLESANGSYLKLLGTFHCRIRYETLESNIKVFVCENVKEFLINRKAMMDLHIIHQHFPKPLEMSYTVKKITQNFLETDTELIKNKLISEYRDVFSNDEILKKMKGNPVHIYLKEDAKPHAITCPRKIPFAWRQKVKDELDEMCKKGIIRPAEDTPSNFISPLVVVQKANGKLRICVDFTKLNQYVIRPVHPFQAPWEAVSNIPSVATYFSTMDATSGYWQLELDEESQKLTTFLTPWGRFQFLRAPMGLVSSGDEYCRRGDIALAGIPNLQKVVDDILIYDKTFEEHYIHIRQVLDRCRETGITLNPEKFVFARPEVSYVGYQVTKDGVKADLKKIEAIQNFPKPNNLTELRSFMGLVNQLGTFSSKISSAAAPLRDLMKIKNDFVWNLKHDEAFLNVRNALVQPPILAHFDPSLPTALHTDASRLNGLGYVLMQKQNDVWKLIQCGSRFLTETESRYAMIEIEMLGIIWSVTKCMIYLKGMKQFEIITDHKPLISILNDKTLDEIDNPRLQRLKAKLIGYTFVAKWRSGKDHAVPDALSRKPFNIPKEEDLLGEESKLQMQSKIIQQIYIVKNEEDSENLNLQDPLLKKLEELAKEDTLYQNLKTIIINGFPKEKNKLSDEMKPYWTVRDELSIENELILKGCQLLIPKTARKMVLDRLHDSHQGIERTKRRARQSVFWPLISNDIKNAIENCEKCQEIRPSLQKESMISEPLPEWPFQDVSADLFTVGGKNYMVYADRLSGWPIVCRYGNFMPNTTKIINDLKKIFADTGVPLKFRSDNGPQLSSYEIKVFFKSWNVIQCTSTPYHAQSNGHAEAAVKAMKNLLKKCFGDGKLDENKWLAGLLEWRNTPREDGYSPAQILYGHPLRSLVPAHHKSFKLEWQRKTDDYDKKRTYQTRRKQYYNRMTKDLPEISIGTRVRIQDAITKLWDREGVILDIGKYRDYKIRLPSGRILTRNRKFLKKKECSEREDG